MGACPGTMSNRKKYLKKNDFVFKEISSTYDRQGSFGSGQFS